MAVIIRALVLACLVGACVAAVHDVTWTVKLDPNTLAVKCGDNIKMAWTMGTHSVARTATDTCLDGTELLEAKAGGSYTYNVSAKDTGTFYLICMVGTHCKSGQKLAVTSTCTNSSSTPAANTTTGNSTKTGTNTTTTPKKDAGDLAVVHHNVVIVTLIVVLLVVLL